MLAPLVLLAACGDDDSDSASSTVSSTSSPSGVAVEGGAIEVVEDGVDPGLSAELVDAGETAFAEVSAPGAVMAVRTPEGTWIGTVGFADIEGTTPMTAEVHQRIGSVTKTFTVTALLQLAEAGQLSLDDPIGDYVEGTTNPDATLRELAMMQSGIPSYTFGEGFQERLFADPMAPWTPEELVGLVEGAESQFEPAAEMFYSNTNTVLLGIVIEQVTGLPIEDVVQQQILDPLGLTGTVFPTDASFPEPHADGYTTQGQEDGAPTDATDWNPSWGWTAGAMISTVDDLLVYGEVLVTGDELLGPDMQAERLSSVENNAPPNTPERAYGLGIGVTNGWYGHSGELPGFNTFVQHNPESGITMVVMANSDIPAGDCPPESSALPDGRTVGPCQDPAVHIGDALAEALGLPLQPE